MGWGPPHLCPAWMPSHTLKPWYPIHTLHSCSLILWGSLQLSANFGIATSRICNCGKRSFETCCITLALGSLAGVNLWLEAYSEPDESISHLSFRFYLRSILILPSHLPFIFQLIYFLRDFRTKSCARVCSAPCVLNDPPSLLICE